MIYISWGWVTPDGCHTDMKSRMGKDTMWEHPGEQTKTHLRQHNWKKRQRWFDGLWALDKRMYHITSEAKMHDFGYVAPTGMIY